MTARRFKLLFDDDATTVYCAAFESEAEREHLLGARPAEPAHARRVDEQRLPGRPSYDVMLAAAVKALRRKLGRCDSLSDRARLVLRHLAETHNAEEMPAASTVRAFLAARPVAENSAEKSAEKSNRARMCRTGGT